MVDSRETYILPKFKKSIVCEHKLYFSSYNYNGFFSVDLETGEAVLEGYFFLEGIQSEMLSGSMLIQGDKIYVTPVLSRRLYYYDLNDKKMRVINKRTMEDDVNEPEPKYCSMILHSSGYIYLISPTEDFMLKIHKDNTYGEAVNIREKYLERFQVDYSYFSDAGYYEYNSGVYIPVEENPVIAEWKKEELKFHELPEIQKGIIKSFGCENKMYLLTCDGEIVMVDLESMKVLKKEKLMAQEIDYSVFRAAYCDSGMGYFMSYTSGRCIKFSLEDCSGEFAEIENEWEIQAYCGETFCFSCFDGESKYFISDRNRLAIVNHCGCRIITLNYNVDALKEHMARRITESKRHEIITEYDMNSDLEVFVQSIYQNKPACQKTDYGAKIYQSMKKIVEN